MNIKDLAWIEKWRPTTVKEVVSPFKEKILKYMENPQSMPNLLFYSKKGGTGKSSMAKAIVHDLGVDCLTLNASKDRSIEVVRTKIMDFVRSKATNGLKRCVFMDECERMTKDSQEALKNLIEEYATNAIFIGTTNNIEKISDPMQSRFICLEFINPDKKEIYKYLSNICKKESLVCEEESLNKLIDINYPSLRRMISSLQDLKVQDKKVSMDNIIEVDNQFKILWTLVVSKKYSEFKKEIIEKGIDVERFNRWIFDNVNIVVDVKKELKIVPLLADSEKYFATSADKQIVFLSNIIKIMMVFKE